MSLAVTPRAKLVPSAAVLAADLAPQRAVTDRSLGLVWPTVEHKDYLLADVVLVALIALVVILAIVLYRRRKLIGVLYGIVAAMATTWLVSVLSSNVWTWFETRSRVMTLLDGMSRTRMKSAFRHEPWLREAIIYLNGSAPAIEPVLWAGALFFIGAIAVFVMGIAASRRPSVQYVLPAGWGALDLTQVLNGAQTISERDLRRFTKENRELAEHLKRETRRLQDAAEGKD